MNIVSSGARSSRLAQLILTALIAAFVYLPQACAATAATVATDYPDYLPGDIVNIHGTGFSAGETVTLAVNHIDADGTPDPLDVLVNHEPWTATAGAQGEITAIWLVTTDCLGATLELTATGRTSGAVAKTTFTDGNLRVAATPGGSPKFTFNVKTVACDASGVPLVGAVVQTVPCDNTGNVFITISSNTGYTRIEADAAATTTASTTYPFVNWTAQSSLGMTDISPANARFKVIENATIGSSAGLTANYLGSQATTTSLSAPAITYGANGIVTVTVTATAGTASPTGTVQLSVDGGTASIVTLVQVGTTASSAATFTLTKPNAGTRSLAATYSPSGIFTGSSTTGTLSVAKVAASVTPNAASKTYGDVDPAFSGVLSGFLAADNVTASYTRTAGENVTVTPYIISATLSPSGVLGNYDITYNTADFTITPKAASWATQSASKTYGDADPSPLTTGSGTGFLPADGVTAVYSRTPGEAVADSPYPVTATLSASVAGALNNYTITNPGANFTITKKALTGSFTANNKPYDGTRAATVAGTSLPGVVGTDAVTLVVSSPLFDTASAGTNKDVTASLSLAGAAAGNYTVNTSHTTKADITRAPLTVTADNKSKTYDTQPFTGFTASYSGFVNSETASVLGGTLAFSGPATTAVNAAPSYTITPGGLTSSNYEITFQNGVLTINKTPLTLTALTNTKVYDGTKTAAAIPTVSGLQGSDTVTGLSESYDTENAGTNKTLAVNTGYSVNDGNAGNNYTVALVANYTGVITPAPAQVTLSNLVQPYLAGTARYVSYSTNPAAAAGSVSVVYTQNDQVVAAPTNVGVYLATATLSGNYSGGATGFLAIYDPTAGFVTGGGWIFSPAGAYADDLSLTGRANFGFCAKYQKGAVKPTGQTDFQFQAGNLKFKSSDYEWLVVSSVTKAQFKGTGTINGVGQYGFLLTAIDGDNFVGTKKGDAFRIKIWEVSSGRTIYDNQPGASETGDDATALGDSGQGGGSIVIQDGGRK